MRRGANTFPSHNRLPNPRFGCETLSFPFLFSGLLRAFPFPPLGWITHGGDSSVIFFRRLFFRALYFSGCDSWRLCWGKRSWPLAGPSSLSESLLACVISCLLGVHAFVHLFTYLLAFICCICWSCCLFVGMGCSTRDKPITQAWVYTQVLEWMIMRLAWHVATLSRSWRTTPRRGFSWIYYVLRMFRNDMMFL